MTVMVGGDTSVGLDISSMSEKDIKDIAVNTTLSHLSISDKPTQVYCHYHKRAIPQYYVSTIIVNQLICNLTFSQQQ